MFLIFVPATLVSVSFGISLYTVARECIFNELAFVLSAARVEVRAMPFFVSINILTFVALAARPPLTPIAILIIAGDIALEVVAVVLDGSAAPVQLVILPIAFVGCAIGVDERTTAVRQAILIDVAFVDGAVGPLLDLAPHARHSIIHLVVIVFEGFKRLVDLKGLLEDAQHLRYRLPLDRAVLVQQLLPFGIDHGPEALAQLHRKRLLGCLSGCCTACRNLKMERI